jgi:hypothetical protein
MLELYSSFYGKEAIDAVLERKLGIDKPDEMCVAFAGEMVLKLGELLQVSRPVRIAAFYVQCTAEERERKAAAEWWAAHSAVSNPRRR